MSGRPPERADGGVVEREFTISEELKERAMDEAPVGITISDPSLPDNPLIYVNEAYERLTGYDASEVLGRNCRFLQGEKSAPEAVAKMREAIDAAEPVSVELVNYRKDGSEFWNKVDIAPVRDETGEVTHYVGFQTDITARKRAEFAAQEWAEELEDLVARIEGLVSDVAALLVRAENRHEIEWGICRRLAESERYGAVWLGERTVVGDAVEPRAWAGCADPPESFSIPLDGADGDAADPVAAAVETGEFRTAGLADPQRWPVGDAEARSGAVAAIPLDYRENSYGVLVVHADDPSAFEGHEAAILEALGRTVATAVDARESKRLFVADDVVELRVELTDPEALFVDVARETGCRLEYEGAVGPGEGTMLLFFTVEGAPVEEVRTLASARPDVLAVDCLVDHDDAGLLEVTVGGGGLVSLLAEYGTRLVGAEVDADGAVLDLEVSDANAARNVFDALSERYGGMSLQTYRERERPPTTRRAFIEEVRSRLTDRQLTALQKAHVGGFFEWPHAIGGDELAQSMGVSRSTYHQHLRAAERKLVEAFFELG